MEVGLASVALPDTNMDLTRLKSYPKPLLRCGWFFTHHQNPSNTTALDAEIEVADMWHDTSIVACVSFMRALVDRFQQIQFDKLMTDKTYVSKDKAGHEKLLDLTFHWD